MIDPMKLDSEPRFYRSGAFAKRARVSVRTLRFYDREGLLSPSEHSLSGHRLYSDEDLITLGRILGLKLMGFTLAEIRAVLSAGSEGLAEALGRQRAMLEARQRQIAQALRTVQDAEAKMRDGTWDWEALQGVIEAMQMNEDKSWMLEHLTPAQIEAITEISNRVQSPEVAQRLAERQWSEADQAAATQAWNEVYAEAERLAAAGASPEGPEGLALGKRYGELLEAWTGGDPEFMAGLQRFYDEAKKLPPEKSPYTQGTWEAMRFAEAAYGAVKDR